MGGGSIIFAGVDPKTNRRFVTQSIEGAGWGGRPTEDGENGSVSICQGDVRNGSIEGIELKCPVLVEGRGLRTGSGGAGKFRGGLGIDMRVRNLVEGRWNFEQTRRSKCPPWGVWGGQLFLNGKILASKRRRGRPPKNPRPEDELPEVPIPEHLREVAVIRIA